MVCHSAQGISQAVIADIHHNVQIITADGSVDCSLSFAGSKSWCSSFDNIGISLISCKSDGGFVIALPLFSPLYQPVIYLCAQLRAAL